MNIPLFDHVSGLLELEMPERETMDQYLDAILPKVRPFSEDVREKAYFVDIRWKEIREGDQFHESVLHIFRPDGGEYMLSVDGNIQKGVWRQLANYNTFILEMGGKSELFDLVFLNGLFMILKKHGDQVRKGNRKYFMLANEQIANGPNGALEWRDLMEILFNLYRENNSPWRIVIAILLILGAFMMYSLWK
jgi:hypothetical protein